MAHAIRYFLVAQNNKDYFVQSVFLDSSDFFTTSSSDFSKEQSLEQIDLFTTQFVHEGLLKRYLYYTGKIDDEDVNLYITFQDNKHNLKFYEVLYNRDDNQNIQDIRRLAEPHCSPDDGNLEVQNIFARFLKRVDHDFTFSKFLDSPTCPIFKTFLKYIKSGRINSHNISSLKYKDGGWAVRSYVLLRNIVEMENRYERLRLISRDVLGTDKLIYENNERQRFFVRDSLLGKTGFYSDPAQYDFFHILDLNQAKVEDVSLNQISKRKPKLVLPDYSDVAWRSKKLYVLDTVRGLLGEEFDFDSSNKVKFNEKFFSCPIAEEDVRCLTSYLDVATRRHFALYAQLKYRYERLFEEQGFYSRQISDDKCNEFQSIVNRISKLQWLNGAYAWSRLYNRYLEQDKQWRTIGEEHGKVFKKRQ